MNVAVRSVGDVNIIDWSGKITLGEGTSAVRAKVRDVVSGGSKKIIMNLAGVNYIDSSGVGELVAAYTTVSNQGGKLKLLNLTKKLREVLAITKLLTVFDVYDDEKNAVESFK